MDTSSQGLGEDHPFAWQAWSVSGRLLSVLQTASAILS